jgi:hypothetical protein
MHVWDIRIHQCIWNINEWLLMKPLQADQCTPRLCTRLRLRWWVHFIMRSHSVKRRSDMWINVTLGGGSKINMCVIITRFVAQHAIEHQHKSPRLNHWHRYWHAAQCHHFTAHAPMLHPWSSTHGCTATISPFQHALSRSQTEGMWPIWSQTIRDQSDLQVFYLEKSQTFVRKCALQLVNDVTLTPSWLMMVVNILSDMYMYRCLHYSFCWSRHKSVVVPQIMGWNKKVITKIEWSNVSKRRAGEKNIKHQRQIIGKNDANFWQ